MTLRMARIGLAAALWMSLPLPVLADEIFDACLNDTAPQDTRCGEEWIAREKARLDTAWEHLTEVADENLARELVAEQRAWESFRDLSCTFKLDEGFGGASGPNGFHACRAGIIAERATAIEGYVSYIDN